MPFEAAKAVAATFCYNIRHALTPVFGNDFVDICVAPDDPEFASFRIDAKIVRSCVLETGAWRMDKEEESSMSGSQCFVIGSAPASLEPTPVRPRDLRPRLRQVASADSDAGTDTGSETGGLSPLPTPLTTPAGRVWTSVNRSWSTSPAMSPDAGSFSLNTMGSSVTSFPTTASLESPGGKRPLEEADRLVSTFRNWIGYDGSPTATFSSIRTPFEPTGFAISGLAHEGTDEDAVEGAYNLLSFARGDGSDDDEHKAKRARPVSGWVRRICN